MALFFSVVPPLVLEGAAVEGGPCGRVEVEGGGSFCSRRVICVWESSVCVCVHGEAKCIAHSTCTWLPFIIPWHHLFYHQASRTKHDNSACDVIYLVAVLSPLGVYVPLSLLLLVAPPEQVAFLLPLPPPLTHSHHCRSGDILNKVNWLASYSC